MSYVLLVEDDEDLLAMMAVELARVHVVVPVATAESALLEMGTRGTPLAVVTDLDLGKGIHGDELLALVRERYPECARLLVSGSPEKMKRGSPHAILGKPWSRGQLLATVAASIAGERTAARTRATTA